MASKKAKRPSPWKQLLDTFPQIVSMEGLSSAQNLQALSALLSTRDEDDEYNCRNMTSSAVMGPGDIGLPSPAANKSAYTKKDSKAIWSEEEVTEGSQFDDLTDTRPKPEYDILLKQNVGTEDVFLGMSRKDPSSMCCDSMLVKIKLPDTKATDVVLDVKEKFLDLRTPNFKLGLHLPHPVHSQDGKAQFYSERQELEVTLPMNRLMDQINLQR